MSPILGIYASQISGHLSTNNFSSIATVTVGSGGSSSISFTSIPSTYTHLQIRALTRTNASGSTSWQSMRFNSSTSGYYDHYLGGNGSTASAGAEALSDRINFGETAGNGATSGMFGVGVIDILDYANINKNKTVRFLDGYDLNGSGAVYLRSGLWQSTSAITQIDIAPQNFGGTAFTQYSSFALYGVK